MLKRDKGDYRIMIIDDDEHFLLGIEGVLKFKEKYNVECYADHNKGISLLNEKRGFYDLLILDYMLNGTTAKEVVREIRKFDKDIYILILTAKSDAPPIQTMQELNIQNYCQKSSQNYENDLLLAIYSALTSVDMMTKIRTVRNGFQKILNSIETVNGLKPIDILADIIIRNILDLVGCKDMFLLIDKDVPEGCELIKGTGKYDVSQKDNIVINDIEYLKKLAEARISTYDDIVEIDDSIFVKIIDTGEQSDIGYICIDFDRKNDKCGDYESIVELLRVYARQVSLTISNSLAYVRTNNQRLAVETQNKELKEHIRRVIEALRIAVDNKDE